MAELDRRDGIERHQHNPHMHKDYEEIEAEPEREQFASTEGILVVWGLPKVTPAKYTKFYEHLKSRFAKRGEFFWDDDIADFYMPFEGYDEFIDPMNPPDVKTKTLGLVFIEFKNENKAIRIMNELNGTPFTTGRKWQIKKWANWMKAGEIEDDFTPPTYDAFQSSNATRGWLEDPEGRDQFLTRWMSNEKHKTSVSWADHRRGGSVLVTDFTNILARTGSPVLTDLEAEWSPMGTYVTTRHCLDNGTEIGVKTWCQGRDDGEWLEHNKFPHLGVDFFCWSPNEKYIVTHDSEQDSPDADLPHPYTCQIWDAETGEKMRPIPAGFCAQAQLEWPYIKYSHDDQFFAILGCGKWQSKKRNENKKLSRRDADKITLYNAKNCKRLDGRSYHCENVKDFKFSPGLALLAYATSGNENRPTNISIIKLPSKDLLVSSSHFQVHNAELIWHPKGRLLCALIRKEKKKKKRKKKSTKPTRQQDDPNKMIASTDLTIFNCLEKGIPRINIDLGKDPVTDLQWDSREDRICVVQQKHIAAGGLFELRIFNALSGRPLWKTSPTFTSVKNVLWSPAGRHICINHDQGNRTFFDTQTLKDKKKLHEGAEEIQWCPSGRFVISTVVSELPEPGDSDSYHGATDNAWVMYNFQGDEIARHDYKGASKSEQKCLFSFQFRPRPPSLLNADQEESVRRRLRTEYWEMFEKQDREIKRNTASKKMKERMDRQQEWKEWKEERDKLAKMYQERRFQLRKSAAYPDGRVSDDEDSYDFEDEPIQEILSYQEIDIGIEELEKYT